MALNFPDTPAVDDSFTSGGKTWVYNGTSWVLVGLPTAIPNDAISTAQISNSAVTESKIANSAITTNKLGNNAVDSTKLADSSVSLGKLGFSIVATSATLPASPFIGQSVYCTDVSETAVWNGTYWESINRSADRNIVINGSMTIAQRNTTSTSATGYLTADRWQTYQYEAGSFTQSISSDYPTGTGFRSSWNLLCTTARTSLNSMTNNMLRQTIEGQNIQHVLKSTASAKKLTLSFWAKSNKTGTYIVELHDEDQPRHVSGSYTINVADTWERKSITFPANTTGSPFDNDTGGSLTLRFHFAAGSTYTSGGTLNTAWDTVGAHQSRSLVGQVNLADTLNNYFRFTGVQLEAGSFASQFEFEPYNELLRRCERYYQKNTSVIEYTSVTSTSRSYIDWQFRTPMRITPTVSNLGATTASATTYDRYYAYRDGGNAVQLSAGAAASAEF